MTFIYQVRVCLWPESPDVFFNIYVIMPDKYLRRASHDDKYSCFGLRLVERCKSFCLKVVKTGFLQYVVKMVRQYSWLWKCYKYILYFLHNNTYHIAD